MNIILSLILTFILCNYLIYALFATLSINNTKLIETIQDQNNRIVELEQHTNINSNKCL